MIVFVYLARERSAKFFGYLSRMGAIGSVDNEFVPETFALKSRKWMTVPDQAPDRTQERLPVRRLHFVRPKLKSSLAELGHCCRIPASLEVQEEFSLQIPGSFAHVLYSYGSEDQFATDTKSADQP